MAKEKSRPGPKNTQANIENVESSLSTTERFIEKHRNLFFYGVIGILVVVFGIIGYNRYVRAPQMDLAWSEAYKAEFYFEKDSFRLALYGDGFYPGFLDIIDEYRKTPAGNAARYYAGVCYMRMGEFSEAKRQLRQFRSNDPMVGAMAICLMGDAEVQLGNYRKAIDYFLDAEKQASNEFLGPIFLMKAARTYEELGEYPQAIGVYNRIETEYYGTTQQNQVAKFIKRAKFLSKQQ